MQIAALDTWNVSIGYQWPIHPYHASRGTTQAANCLIVRLTTEGGLVGWGEGTGRLPDGAAEVLAGRHPGDLNGTLAALKDAGGSAGSSSAVEMACWDLLGKAAGVPLCMLLGGRKQERVELCACMGIQAPATSAAWARDTIDRWGFRYIKTKAGRDMDQDIAIARAIQEAIGDDARLRPDANCAYSPEQAERLIPEMDALGVYAYEDVCGAEHLETLAGFRRRFDILIVNNMGVSDPASVKRIVDAEAADLLMPDTTSSGGILPVTRCAAVAAAAEVPCVMHCSHDIGLKTAAVAHVAAAVPNWVGGSDTTYHGLLDDILTELLVIEDGALAVPSAPGLGVQVDEDKLRHYSREA